MKVGKRFKEAHGLLAAITSDLCAGDLLRKRRNYEVAAEMLENAYLLALELQELIECLQVRYETKAEKGSTK